ncbi:hypothetical protein EG329_011269 [Mollisiaceae sp. DMI_Dod_QoI]|nr:hypothetical protein EG329_011269 [Helotiales sp. DMI_Dod_QoI]
MSSTISMTSTATSTSTATPSCISVTPDKNGYVPEWACNANYNYYPSFAAALIFAVIFGITTFVHFYQAFAYKKFRLCWVLLVGALWEFASFAIRSAGTKNQQSTPLAFVSQILVLLAPMWINAFCYMVMGRMIYFFVPSQKIFGIKGIKIAKIFVWLDVLSFLTQLGGGVMISPGSSASTLMTGIHLYMGGIGFQEFCILLFTLIAVKFFIDTRLRERTTAGNQILDGRPTNWRTLLYVMFAVLALITMRIIFRLVEYAGGIDAGKNKLPYHEVYFLVLDAAPMFIALVLFNIVHPGMVLKGEGSEFPKGLSRKEKREAKRVRKEEKRAAKEAKKALKREEKEGKAGSSLMEEIV